MVKDHSNNNRVSEGGIPRVVVVLCVNALSGVAFFYEAPSKVHTTDALERWETYPLTERGHQTGVVVVVVFTLKAVPISTQYFLTFGTGPTDANAFRGHRLTTQKGYTHVIIGK